MHTFSDGTEGLCDEVVHDECEAGEAVFGLGVPAHVSQDGHRLEEGVPF